VSARDDSGGGERGPIPVLASPFRPFFLLGPLYGVILALAWSAAWSGLGAAPAAWPLHLWHGHEMLFGFAAAMVSGFVLTALPGWAGTRELHGGALAALVAAWLAGRLAFWAAPWLPPWLVAVVDGGYFLLLAGLVVPELLRLRARLYLWLVPVFAAFLIGNVVFHAGPPLGVPGGAAWGLKLALYGLLLLFSFVGGLLTPIFTGNELRARGRAAPTFVPTLERLAVIAVLLYAATDLVGLAAEWRGAAALFAAVVHGVRLARWHGLAVRDQPLLWAMHLGYAWLVAAFALRAAADLAGAPAPDLALHAFTVGAFGMMKLSLMTRVALRHTGRPLRPAPAMVAAFALIGVAALLRVAGAGSGALLVASALLWGGGLALYLAVHGAMLLRPSLPRGALA
jgi:uncharacterized protein involved in response to NO